MSHSAEITNHSFASLNLAAPLLKNIEALGYTQATPVQAQVIPATLEGGDLLVSSQTGSGKTAAFLLPLLHQLVLANPHGSPVPGRAQPKILVLCPTRELAQQVATDAINLARGIKSLRIATIMGGMPYGKQIQAIKGASLVVATPGRLLDLFNSRAIRLDQVECLVVDEADRMLDLGFAEDLEAIDERCKGRSQTLMFSATFAPRIMSLASNLTKDAKRIELAHAGEAHANIAQKLHWADSQTPSSIKQLSSRAPRSKVKRLPTPCVPMAIRPVPCMARCHRPFAIVALIHYAKVKPVFWLPLMSLRAELMCPASVM
jgi:superfamily II DNA/RNA helicase